MSLPSGDRHLRREPTGRIARRPGALATIGVMADDTFAATVAGQHLLLMLVNLLARQFGVVGTIAVNVPNVALDESISWPGVSSKQLAAAVIEMAHFVAGPEMEIRASAGQPDSDVLVLAGSFDPTVYDVPAVAAVADGWRCAVCSTHLVPPVSAATRNPVGPYLAACMAAWFVFDVLCGSGRPVDASISLWDAKPAQWPALAVGAEPEGLILPDCYLIGAGAVGAALVRTIAAIPRLRGRIVAADPQEQSRTDRNRLVSGGYNTVGMRKVDLVAAEARPGLQIYPVHGRWPDDYVTRADRAVPPNLREREEAFRYEWVLSCVDRNRDRQGIARYMPRHVIGGSTDGLVAQAVYYSMIGTCECLACNHPVLRPETLEELTTMLAGPAARAGWLQSHGADAKTAAAVEEYLNAPQCGGLGEAELARLGREGEVDWSVGFVSVAAGVLQAAIFIRCAQLGVVSVTGDRPELRLLFHSLELVASAARRGEDCGLCSDPEILDQWREQWEPGSGTPPN